MSILQIPYFQVHENFEYSAALGAYNLTIELVIPIDFVVVQSQLPIRLMEVEKNASVVSEVHQDGLNPWPLLASYRCQANVCRLELRVQASEGDSGVINLYVCPKIMPKCAQVRITVVTGKGGGHLDKQIDRQRRKMSNGNWEGGSKDLRSYWVLGHLD